MIASECEAAGLEGARAHLKAPHCVEVVLGIHSLEAFAALNRLKAVRLSACPGYKEIAACAWMQLPQTKLAHKTGDLAHKTGDLDYETGDLTHNTRGLAHKPGDLAHKKGDLAHKTGDVAHKTRDLAYKTGDLAYKTGDLAHKTGDLAHKTGDLAHLSIRGLGFRVVGGTKAPAR